MNYEKYLSDCKVKGFKPTMTEKQFNDMLGIEPTHKHEPIPQRQKKPTVKKSLTVEKLHVDVTDEIDHIREATKKVSPPKKPKASTTPNPKISTRKYPKLTDEEKRARKQDRQRAYYQRKVGREVKQRSAPMVLSHLTPEEKRQHRLKKQKEYRERRKAAGIKEVRTAEQKAQRNEYFKHYYELKKNDPQYMAKRAKTTMQYRNRKSA